MSPVLTHVHANNMPTKQTGGGVIACLYRIHTITLRAFTTYYLWGKKVFTNFSNP